MSAKILVADDSATIQKVVKITLAEEPFELLEAQNEEALFTALRAGNINLVLLDFNLSEDKSGYQLAEEITKKYPKTSVLAMLGTFDSVDGNQLTKAGVADKIVKPFDSQKFVGKCHALIEAMPSEEEPEDVTASLEQVEQVEEIDEEEVEFCAPEEELEVELEDTNKEESAFDPSLEDEILESQEDAGENWVVESSAPIEEKEGVPVEDMLEQVQSNILEDVTSDWAGEVPGVIGAESTGLMPPVIEDEENQLEEGKDAVEELNKEDEEEEANFDLDATSTFRLADIKAQEDQKTPDEEDLEYPETIQMYQPQEEEKEEESVPKPSSQLVSIDELSPDDEEEDGFEDDSTDPAIDLEASLELEKEVAKEVSPDDIWAVDEEMEEDAPNMEGDDMASVEVDYDKLVVHLKEQLGPFIENIIKDICTQNVEKVAWEVIPDLAENLIKKELKNISSTIDQE